ncbi:MAG: hypothetical protein ACYDCI_00435 [Candidatus Limnocylindrales bacterium]
MTHPRRIMLTQSPPLERSLRTLGLDPDIERDGLGRGLGAPQIVGIIARYADAIERASRELDRLISRNEWLLLADILNGFDDRSDWSFSPFNSIQLLVGQVQDGQHLDGAGDKWLADGGKPRSGDAATAKLVAKLRECSPIHGDAILAAVRWFWAHSDTVDAAEDRWWVVDFRRKEGVEHARPA